MGGLALSSEPPENGSSLESFVFFGIFEGFFFHTKSSQQKSINFFQLPHGPLENIATRHNEVKRAESDRTAPVSLARSRKAGQLPVGALGIADFSLMKTRKYVSSCRLGGLNRFEAFLISALYVTT